MDIIVPQYDIMCDIMLTLLLVKKVINAKQIFIKLPEIIGKIIVFLCVCVFLKRKIYFSLMVTQFI